MTLFSDTDTIPSAASLYHQNLSLSLSLSLSGIQHALWIKIKLTSFSLFSSLPTTKPTFIFPPLYFPKSPSGSLVSEPLLFLQPFTPFLIPTEKKGWFLFYSCLLILFLLPLIACWESLLFWVFGFLVSASDNILELGFGDWCFFRVPNWAFFFFLNP